MSWSSMNKIKVHKGKREDAIISQTEGRSMITFYIYNCMASFLGTAVSQGYAEMHIQST